ncbi:unnamed protein product [Rotaria sp. Silwood1]|nr:unnamed protein product [Rotaria sp. Silwood1]CAF4656251.1 unnamed protein product [Rotaria sp. Silwood1]
MPTFRNLLFIVCLLSILIQIFDTMKEIIVASRFHLHVRMHNSQSASVYFKIAKGNHQQICQMYKFTISHNHQHPYLISK